MKYRPDFPDRLGGFSDITPDRVTAYIRWCLDDSERPDAEWQRHHTRREGGDFPKSRLWQARPG